jgi:exonuclease SbcD
MIRVIATGDNHWDEHTRWDECVRIHGWIADLVEQERPDAFVIGGDIYERASTPKEREAVAAWLTRVAEVCPVVIAKGNHDRARDLALLARLATRHPIIVEERAGVHLVAGIAIATMAWPSRAALLAALDATDSAIANETEHAALEAVLRGFGVALDAHAGPSLLLGHFMVDGSMTSTGQPLHGHAMNVGLTSLALARADAVLMSHVHMPQAWDVDGKPVLYMGSPYRTSYGELEAKSVTLVELHETGGVASWWRIETPARPMLHVTATLADSKPELGEGYARVLLFDGELPDMQGAEVRLRYAVPSDEREQGKTLAAGARTLFLERGAVDVKVEETVIPVVRARAPEVAKALTLTEKVTAYWKSRDDVPEPARASALISKVHTLEEELAHAL